MARRGHQVTVVTRALDDAARVVRDEGFEVRYRRRPRVLRRVTGLAPVEAFAFTAGAAGLGIAADLNHAFYISDAYGLALAGRLRPRPLIFSWHGIPSRRWWETNEPRTHAWYLRMMRRAARITVMTDSSAQRLRDDYGYDPVVLTPGIFVADYQLPRPEQPQRTIVCAAAVDDGRKRLDVLLAAFERVAAEEPDLHLLLVGGGDPSAVKGQAAAMDPKIGSRVECRFTTDLPSVYAQCTVGALTSFREAFGLVVVEYLAAGIPAVVSDDGGSPQILAPGTGAVFKQGDPDDCARALRDALALAADPGTAALCRLRAQDYDWSARVEAYERLYASVG